MALDLLPLSTEAPRCSEFARSIAVLPPGSGLFLDRVILVSVPLPWPKPALSHEMLVPLNTVVTASAAKSRLFAMEPDGEHSHVEVYERVGATAALHRWQVADSDELLRVISAVADCPLGSLDTLQTRRSGPIVVPPTFLVCTQGSHDSCCGSSGVALADEIEATRPDYVVRRVSHTGGHRFSPTFLAFPEGRMWAFADLDLVDRIASDTISSHDVTAHARGWWGAKVGAAQVAECAVRAEQAGAPFVEPHIEAVASVPVDGAPVDRSPANSDTGEPVSEFRVASNGTSFRVTVRVERSVPSIACEAPGGLPAKPGREFGWSIERT